MSYGVTAPIDSNVGLKSDYKPQTACHPIFAKLGSAGGGTGFGQLGLSEEPHGGERVGPSPREKGREKGQVLQSNIDRGRLRSKS